MLDFALAALDFALAALDFALAALDFALAALDFALAALDFESAMLTVDMTRRASGLGQGPPDPARQIANSASRSANLTAGYARRTTRSAGSTLVASHRLTFALDPMVLAACRAARAPGKRVNRPARC